MRPEWQGGFRAPLSGEPLRFEGTLRGDPAHAGEWADGHLVSPRGKKVARVADGIVDFVEMPTGGLDMKRVKEERLAESGWGSQRALLRKPVFQEACDAILSSGPLIVELGAGSGGGHMPMVLERDPLAVMLVNDFEYRMLAEWKTFLASRGLGQNLSFACFDACNMPIASASVDCVSSHGCFCNIIFHKELAVKEAFRVLRPGGVLVAIEGQVVKPPVDVIRGMLTDPAMGGIWMMMPGLITGWAALAESVGFIVEKDRVLVRRAVTTEDGEFGRLATQSGIAVEAEFRCILARKRGPLGH